MSKKVFTASLLVAGTAIGAGMLALPIATGPGGFWPAILIYIICWIYSAATGLLLLEACFWLPKDTNIVSLSADLLGKKAKAMSWVLYLFLFYSLTMAYAAGGGGVVNAVVGGSLSAPIAIGIFVLLFSSVVYMGTKAVDRLNFILMIGLIASFIAFIVIASGKVNHQFLLHADWKLSVFSLPIVFTSFSYQGIVPSMRNYFSSRPKDVRKVILIGSTIPFFVYVIWEYLILGSIPLQGAHGLLEAKQQGLTAVDPLKHFAVSTHVYAIGQAFAFFALTTSFLGVTLGLFDFLSDGLKLKKSGRSKLFTYLLVFVPPTLIAMYNPKIFLRALGYAGGIGCALILGLFPVLMVWSGRYRKKLPRKHQQLFGGKVVLLLILAFIAFELVIELLNEWG